MHRWRPSAREMKGLCKGLAGLCIAQAADGNVMRWRAEAEGIGRIEEGAEERGCGKTDRAARRNIEGRRSLHDALRAVAQAGQVERQPARFDAVVDDMGVQTSAPLQDEPGRRHSPKAASMTSPLTARDRSR